MKLVHNPGFNTIIFMVDFCWDAEHNTVDWDGSHSQYDFKEPITETFEADTKPLAKYLFEYILYVYIYSSVYPH